MISIEAARRASIHAVLESMCAENGVDIGSQGSGDLKYGDPQQEQAVVFSEAANDARYTFQRERIAA